VRGGIQDDIVRGPAQRGGKEDLRSQTLAVWSEDQSMSVDARVVEERGISKKDDEEDKGGEYR
jgi:hypothetical protein